MDKTILVSGYVNPDLDAYACAAGYAELLKLQHKKAQGARFGQPLGEVSFVLGLVNEPILPEPDPSKFDDVVIVDTSEARFIPSQINPAQVVEVIDHHLYNDPADFPNAALDIQAVGAAATLVAERFQAAGLNPRREIAALLYAAIISNTLNFKAAVSTDRDELAAAWLWDLAQLPDDFILELFRVKSDVAGEKLHELLALDMSACEAGGKLFSIGQLELVGVPELLAERQAEIEELLHTMGKQQQSHVTFMSLSDVVLGKTYFLTPYDDTRQVLEEVLGVPFDGGVAEYPRIILRKEYVGPVRERVLSAQ